MISTQYIKLNMTPSGVLPVLYCSQYDIGRPLGLVVYNDSVPVDLDTYTATIEATRTDGTPITAAVTTDDNIGVFVTTAEMTNKKDKYLAKLVLVDSVTNRVASLAFIMVITPATMDENAEPIQEDRSLYQQYTVAVQALIGELRTDVVDLQEQKVQRYDNVSQMTADYDLKPGMYVRTGGYHAVNDGGGALYRIYYGNPGTYYETLANGYYARLIIPDSGAVTPEMYGAHGDGVADDTAALQRCVNNASLIHALGQYKISAGIELHSHLRICGFGKGTILKDANTTVHFASLYYYMSDHSDVSISDVTLDGLVLTGLQYWTGQTLTGRINDFGIRLIGVDNVTISKCICSEFGGCAVAVRGNGNHFEGNHIRYTGTFTGDVPNYNFGINYSGIGTVIKGNSISGVIQGIISGLVNTSTVISDNDISTNGQHGLYMESGINVVVDSNTIHDCTICGIKFQLADESLTEFQDIIISNNVIKNCGGQGVFIVDLIRAAKTIQKAIIDSNVIDDCSRCVQIGAAYNVIISNNVLNASGAGAYGIYLGIAEDYSIIGNRINAIDCNGVIQNIETTDPGHNKYAFISDNVFMVKNNSATAYQALRMHHGTDISITGNKLHFSGTNTATDGIFISGSTSGNITDMHILNNIASGFRWDLRVTAPDGVTIDGNFFKKKTGI